MRITDLKVDGFGVWHGLELSDLSEQVNVFYGPNEAGKTTLMQFVRTMLYGFSPERRARYLPPVRGGRPGGALQAVAGQKTYEVSRFADLSGELADTLRVSDGLQTHDDARAILPVVGDIDETIFNNVFAFGLREIQELGTLSDTQAAEELYNLSLGLERVSLSDVLGELESSRNRLLAPDDRPSLVAQLLSQRQRLQGEIENLAHTTTRYLSLAGERRKLDGEIRKLETESAQWEAQSRELTLVRSLSERWQRRNLIDQQLNAVAGMPEIPDNALTRFDRAGSKLAALRRGFLRLKAERRELRSQIEDLHINDGLVRHAMRLESLGEQQQWIKSLSDQTTQLENELLELETERDNSRKQFAKTPQKVGSPLSPRGVIELRTAARNWREAQSELRRLREQLANSRQAASAHQQRVAAAMEANRGKLADDRTLTQQLTDAGELVSQLRRRVQLDEKIDNMSRREAELNDQSQEHLANQILPTWALAGLGSLFVLGCAMLLLYLAGLILPASLSSSLGWPLGFFGVAAVAFAGGAKFLMERNAVEQLDSCHGQIGQLSQQMQDARAEREELDRKLPRGGGPLVARLQAAEKELTRLEGLLPLESQRESSHRDHQDAERDEQQARDRSRKLHKTWQRLLAEHGLPPTLRPRDLRTYVESRDALGDLDRTIETKQAELTRRRGDYDAITRRIKQLVTETGVTPLGKSPLEQLEECLADLGRQQMQLKRREELRVQDVKLRRRQTQFRQRADALRERRTRLLRAAGAKDELELRRRAQVLADADRLRDERSQVTHEIVTALAGHLTEDKLNEWLSSRQDLEQLETQLADARQAAFGSLNQALERRGEMNQQLKILADDRQIADRRIELGIVEKRLQDAIDRWRVLAVCRMMLEAVRAFYEREHQPQALREASAYLQRLTQGRYLRVWTPLGEHSLRVDDEHGNVLPAEVLSRGTREQLFLALRLALISSYARRGARLPLVLDDIFVNFDLGRAKAAATVLRDFARDGHQVLIFTCHEHISRLFKTLKAEVRQLPDNSRMQAFVVEEEPPAPIPVEEPAPVEVLPEPVVVLPVLEPIVVAAPVLEPIVVIEPEPEWIPQLEDVEPLPEPASSLPVPIEPLPTITPPVAELVAPPPEPAPPPPAPPKPAPKPERKLVRQRRPVFRAHWSAEEFDGELADRVRGGDSWEEVRWEVTAAGDSVRGDDDAEAA